MAIKKQIVVVTAMGVLVVVGLLGWVMGLLGGGTPPASSVQAPTVTPGPSPAAGGAYVGLVGPTIRVVDTNGNPLTGVRVGCRWKDFGYVKRGDDSALTDGAGNAVFPVLLVTGTTSQKIGKWMKLDRISHGSSGEMSEFTVGCPVGYRPRMPIGVMAATGQHVTVWPGGVSVIFQRLDKISFTVTMEAEALP